MSPSYYAIYTCRNSELCWTYYSLISVPIVEAMQLNMCFDRSDPGTCTHKPVCQCCSGCHNGLVGCWLIPLAQSMKTSIMSSTGVFPSCSAGSIHKCTLLPVGGGAAAAYEAAAGSAG